MKKLFLALIISGLLISGCAQIQTPPNEKFAEKINQALLSGHNIEEIEKQNLKLPADIIEKQIKKYFKLDNMIFALVLQGSMNFDLEFPKKFTPTFTGILVAQQNKKRWTKLLEIKDNSYPPNYDGSVENNPYYLWSNKGKLSISIIDSNGAGSGEGIMKVFTLAQNEIWELTGCYYFGGHYSDSEMDGDYFAYSSQLSKQEPEPMKTCSDDVILIPYP